MLKGKDATPFAPCLKPFLFGWVDFDFLGGEEEGKGAREGEAGEGEGEGQGEDPTGEGERLLWVVGQRQTTGDDDGPVMIRSCDDTFTC